MRLDGRLRLLFILPMFAVDPAGAPDEMPPQQFTRSFERNTFIPGESANVVLIM
jgi:hypothetical protein